MTPFLHCPDFALAFLFFSTLFLFFLGRLTPLSFMGPPVVDKCEAELYTRMAPRRPSRGAGIDSASLLIMFHPTFPP
jgi:hypothetical protein